MPARRRLRILLVVITSASVGALAVLWFESRSSEGVDVRTAIQAFEKRGVPLYAADASSSHLGDIARIEGYFTNLDRAAEQGGITVVVTQSADEASAVRRRFAGRIATLGKDRCGDPGRTSAQTWSVRNVAVLLRRCVKVTRGAPRRVTPATSIVAAVVADISHAG